VVEWFGFGIGFYIMIAIGLAWFGYSMFRYVMKHESKKKEANKEIE